MALPGTAAIPAVDARRARRRGGDRARARSSSRARGPAAVADPHRRRRSTTRSRVLMALGGIDERRHPPARARRPRRASTLGARPLRRALAAHAGARERPSRRRAPGRGPRSTPAACRRVLHELAPLLDREALTRERHARSAENSPRRRRADRDRRSRPLEQPLAAEGGLAVLRGSLAPGGALIKRSAASPGAAAPPRPGGRVRGRLRPGRADRRPATSTVDAATRCWCCATAARKARPGCPSGGSCRSRASCSRAGSRTWCGSRTRA